MSRTTTFRAKNQKLVDAAVSILQEEKPMTLRQLYYRAISAGVLQNSQAEYKRLGSIMTRLREAGELPRTWIVDHVRSTLKPSSWSGLEDFTESMQRWYRKDFWASMDVHIEVFVEKDAIAGTIQPVTHDYDVALRVCRGYASVSFAGEIADLWRRIKKPIHAYYLGDFDPSGFDIERDLRNKLEVYSDRPRASNSALLDKGSFLWTRLAVRAEDFAKHNLIELPVKELDTRSKGFMRKHGGRCAEVDAIPPTELRARVEEAIGDHIDEERWKRLLETERVEQESLKGVIGSINRADEKES